jgi:hypothetical protein
MRAKAMARMAEYAIALADARKRAKAIPPYGLRLLVTDAQVFCRLSTGTGIPAIFSFTENSVLRLMK